MSSEVKRFNPDALGDMRENLAGEYVSATDYDTVSAELREFKNGNTMSLLRAGFAKACEERDAALAQLAAIQQAKGEEVEVVGSAAFNAAGNMVDFSAVPQLEAHPEGHRVEQLMTVAQHQRVTAAMAAEVETWRSNAVMLEQANAGLAQLNGKLRAELAAVKGQIKE